jgi:glutamyl-tRNA reductase
MSRRVNVTRLTAWLSFLVRQASEEARRHPRGSDARNELVRATMQLGYAVRTVTTTPDASHAVGCAAVDLIARAAVSRAFTKETP